MAMTLCQCGPRGRVGVESNPVLVAVCCGIDGYFGSTMPSNAALFALSAAIVGGLGVPSGALARDQITPAGRQIVGGEPADIKHHPWQIAVEVKIRGKSHLCGGSLIASRWVLTAAHCVHKAAEPSSVRAKSGVTNYLTEGVWLDAQSIVVHEGYNRQTYEHDIALLRLGSQPPNSLVITLATSAEIRVGQPLEVTGWGGAFEGNEESRVLLEATVPYAENATCNERSSYNGKLGPAMMCAGHRDQGIDSCHGDIGGPLVWRRSPYDPVLVGLVAWSDGCARKLRLGVYTRVSSYREWIAGVIAKHGQ